jgi:hypothetical protein
MQQEFLILAEAAEATNGKIYVLGGGIDRHYVQKDWKEPIQLRADIAVGILVDWNETNNRHGLAIRIVDEDDKEIAKVDGEFETGRPPGAKLGQQLRNLIAIRGPFPLPRPGAYKVVLELDGARQEPPFRFWVDVMGESLGTRP